MRKIGMTGGVGAGKSEVLTFLEREYGACVVRADEVGHEVMEPGEAAFEAILAEFGEEMRGADGRIDRKRLGGLVFADPARLAALNAIVHPAVRCRIEEKLKKEEEKGTTLFVLEAAILLEAGYRELVDELWYVDTKREIRMERLMATRGYTKEKCLDIMGNQLSEEAYTQAAEVVIDNSGKWEETEHAIRKHCQWQQW